MTESGESDIMLELELARESIPPSISRVVNSIIRRSNELIKKPDYSNLSFTDKILYRTGASLYTKNPIEYKNILDEWGKFKEDIGFPFGFAREEQVLIFIIYFDFHNGNSTSLEGYLDESSISRALSPELRGYIVNHFNKVSAKRFPKSR